MIITNILVNEEKTCQTNIAVNGLYDTKLCGSKTVLVSYKSFTTMLV